MMYDKGTNLLVLMTDGQKGALNSLFYLTFFALCYRPGGCGFDSR
jgi:hypothetical protein